jgi:streptogramin lyase
VTVDRRMRQAAESVRRYSDQEVDPVAMLWRLRTHQRRRSRRTAAVALAVLAGLVAAAVLVIRSPRQPEVLTPPGLGRVAATIALPQAPFPRVVGVADGLVWVDGDNATAYRVDPQSNRVAGTVRLPAGSRLAAVGRGSLWLTNDAAGTVSQADPGSGTILQTVTVGAVQEKSHPHQEGLRLALDGDAVWVARLQTEVVRIDWAGGGTITRRFTVGVPGSARYDLIAAGGGAAITHGGQQDAALLDPQTGKVTTVPLGGTLAGVAFGAGSFWVSAEDYTLARIDPTSRRVTATVRLDGQHLPGAVVVGGDAVWVFASGLLQRIDPAANRVVHTLQVGPQEVETVRLAAGAGAVWLSDATARTLLRIDPQG